MSNDYRIFIHVDGNSPGEYTYGDLYFEYKPYYIERTNNGKTLFAQTASVEGKSAYLDPGHPDRSSITNYTIEDRSSVKTLRVRASRSDDGLRLEKHITIHPPKSSSLDKGQYHRGAHVKVSINYDNTKYSLVGWKKDGILWLETTGDSSSVYTNDNIKIEMNSNITLEALFVEQPEAVLNNNGSITQTDTHSTSGVLNKLGTFDSGGVVVDQLMASVSSNVFDHPGTVIRSPLVLNYQGPYTALESLSIKEEIVQTIGRKNSTAGGPLINRGDLTVLETREQSCRLLYPASESEFRSCMGDLYNQL